jgi:hypothetical protein
MGAFSPWYAIWPCSPRSSSRLAMGQAAASQRSTVGSCRLLLDLVAREGGGLLLTLCRRPHQSGKDHKVAVVKASCAAQCRPMSDGAKQSRCTSLSQVLFRLAYQVLMRAPELLFAGDQATVGRLGRPCTRAGSSVPGLRQVFQTAPSALGASRHDPGERSRLEPGKPRQHMLNFFTLRFRLEPAKGQGREVTDRGARSRYRC